mmetsp:Transcript_29671/g.47257  ORF Transcript_29671/g.47257 Transcript_29671/m.47257 type:complete len:81 (+) Transcript_29671:134-376(+)
MHSTRMLSKRPCDQPIMPMAAIMHSINHRQTIVLRRNNNSNNHSNHVRRIELICYNQGGGGYQQGGYNQGGYQQNYHGGY